MLNESQFLNIFQKIHDQLFWKKHFGQRDVATMTC